MYSRAVIACAIGALLSGCAVTNPPSGGDVSTAAPPGAERFATNGHNPALVFATPEMQQMLAARGLAPGFGLDDWEYGRNDERLAAGATPLRSVGYSAFEITQSDHLYESNGRPYSSSRMTFRSIRSGRSR